MRRATARTRGVKATEQRHECRYTIYSLPSDVSATNVCASPSILQLQTRLPPRLLPRP